MTHLDFPLCDISALRIPLEYRRAIYLAAIQLWKNKSKLKMKYLFLFGSCAKECVWSESDIDLLILTDGDSEKEIRMELYDIYDPDVRIEGIPVQITVMRTKYFLDGNLDPIGFNKEIYNTMRLIKKEI